MSVESASRAEELSLFVSAFAAGDAGAIHAYRIDLSSGKLRHVARNGGIEHPFFFALAPSGKYLYSIHAPGQFGGKEDEQLQAFSVDAKSGQLKPLNRQSTRGTASCYVEVDATGKAVLVANYLTGSVASYPVGADGTLGEPASFVQHAGASVDKARQEGPHAHCFVISPDNQYAFAADLGLDQILTYRLNPGAKLTAGRQPFVRTIPGAGPRHLTFHPQTKRMYVINELANSITAFDWDAASATLVERQTIATLPADFKGTSHCADLKITPDGRFLYGTNRGHDSIAAYAIDESGTLKLLGIEPSRGKGPQNLAITPDGKFLLCANMPGNNLAVFRIDAQSGALTLVGEPVETTGPSCIRFLP